MILGESAQDCSVNSLVRGRVLWLWFFTFLPSGTFSVGAHLQTKLQHIKVEHWSGLVGLTIVLCELQAIPRIVAAKFPRSFYPSMGASKERQKQNHLSWSGSLESEVLNILFVYVLFGL